MKHHLCSESYTHGFLNNTVLHIPKNLLQSHFVICFVIRDSYIHKTHTFVRVKQTVSLFSSLIYSFDNTHHRNPASGHTVFAQFMDSSFFQLSLDMCVFPTLFETRMGCCFLHKLGYYSSKIYWTSYLTRYWLPLLNYHRQTYICYNHGVNPTKIVTSWRYWAE